MLGSTIRVVIGCAFLLSLAGFGAESGGESVQNRASRLYREAQVDARQHSNSVSSLAQLARAAFEWAEFARRDEDREGIALTGIQAARRGVELERTNSAAHYWLGMNLGQLARTKTLGALKLVREMEDEFGRARYFDPSTDYAGPDRSLGLLYRDAPGWPTSIGSRKKAREHLEQAVKLRPEFPDNHLALLESYDEWGERQNFERQLKLTEQIMLTASERYPGPEWESSRLDWEKRLTMLKSRAGKVGKSIQSKGGK